ncbi:hypothetical protein ACKFKG_31530 [Phormidesmis sp. 146-35]
MNAIEQLESLRLPVGAKPGQAILFVDLTEIDNSSEVLQQLSLNYEISLRYLETAIGLHVVAVLREFADITDEQHEKLLEEWESLATRITPDDPNKAVRLWRGHAGKTSSKDAA